ncbi:MAG: ATP-binding protein [Myxococcaceae bacterium]|nr:ATP-binding protein [Myxococcaceae bacterium]
MYPRRLAPPEGTTLLLGPRATGKSTWLEQVLPDATRFDLLDTRLARDFAADPSRFAREVEALPAGAWVVVDEVQKVPALLDEVHRLDGKKGRRFVLSGSSARKLKRGGANLLAGRALRRDFFPLVSAEIGAALPLERVAFGALPRVLGLQRPHAYLESYVDTYLREEVQAEALTRNLGGFARFLEVAARQNGQVTNVSNIARDAQVARPTVQGFFDVLVDTLLGFWLPAWKLKPGTKLVAHPKFYFFDAGVARTLTRRLAYPPTPEELGTLFETWLLHEVRAFLSYSGLTYPLSYFRTHDAVEADVVLETRDGFLALEFKASDDWRASFNAGFKRLRNELPNLTCVGVFTGRRSQKADGFTVMPYASFLETLWDGTLIR